MAQKSLYDELLRVKQARMNSNNTSARQDGGHRRMHDNNNKRKYPANLDFMKPYRDVMTLLEDGVDHINIWSSATTDMGSVLDHAGPLPLNHSVFGYFDTMTAFWYYIQSEERDDRIRGMQPLAAYRFGKMMTSRRVINFRAIIADSNWQRIKSKPLLIKMLEQSDLPFDAYRVNNETGLRTRPPFFGWLLWSFEEIRKAIKENREPNFSSLLDRRNSDIYEFAIVRPQKVSVSESVKPVTQPVETPVVASADMNEEQSIQFQQRASDADYNIDDGEVETNTDATPAVTDVK
jgi:hypothetical protein